MIPELREKFNAEFKQEVYEQFLEDVNTSLKYPTDFRVSETPIFLSEDFNNKLLTACSQVCEQIQSNEFKNKSNGAIPPHLIVPNEDEHTQFFQLDFAICKSGDGTFYPKLIELQGFPSLYGFQSFINERIRKYFDIPENFSSYFSGLKGETYRDVFKRIILGSSDPENVILLEIDPAKQKTRIDFAATEKLTGIHLVCITDIIKKGKKLFYKKDGTEIPIERIYNRVIFDELNRKEIDFNFDFRYELDVKWLAHPNWFFKISKYSLPSLKGKYVPKCYFLNELEEYPDELENYVLKPLFSFAGHGVEIDLTKEMINSIDDPENYILQEKVEYAPLIKTPDGYSKVEIRMMFLWDDKPQLVNNLVRMSKGKMIGVDYNKNKSWVGSTIAFHP